ncbi:hypothetical protein JCM21900_003815 [Sporobolomyces salmonicolor]
MTSRAPSAVASFALPRPSQYSASASSLHPTSSPLLNSTNLSRPLSPVASLLESASTSSVDHRYGGRYPSDDESSSSPERSPAAPSPPSASTGPSSPKRGKGLASSPVPSCRGGVGGDDDDEAGEADLTPLPTHLPRPKSLADRERERQLGLGGGSGRKDSLATKLARKRADSLKWAKYANIGTFEVDLSLSNDELRRS